MPPRLRPRGAGDLLDETIRLFRQNFRMFVVIVAVVQVPILVLQLVQVAVVGTTLSDLSFYPDSPTYEWGPIIFWLLSSLAIMAVSLFAFVAMGAALASAIAQRYLGRPSTVGSAYRRALACFWRMLGTTLVVSIALGLVSMTIIGIPLAIYIGIRWAFVVQALALEDKGVGSSLSRSWVLVKDSWWRTFGILIVAGLAQYLVAAIPGSVIGAVVAGIGAAISPDALFVATLINTVVGGVFGILAAPLMPVVITLLYYDLRIRKEGFDLQILAERLGQSDLPAVQG